jgi:putative membrane protein
MNTKFKIGHLFLSAAVLSLILTASCKQQPKNEDTKEVAEDVNDATETAKDSVTDARNDDSDYLIAAAETDMMEIELGKLALKKTTNAKVKELANMMIEQHTKASATLKSLAASKQVAIPAALTDKGKEAYDDLDRKSGRDFDDAYADKMVDGHEDAISKIKDASKNAKDAEIRQWAADMLPTLNTHLEHSKMLQDQIKKTK